MRSTIARIWEEQPFERSGNGRNLTAGTQSETKNISRRSVTVAADRNLSIPVCCQVVGFIYLLAYLFIYLLTYLFIHRGVNGYFTSINLLTIKLNLRWMSRKSFEKRNEKSTQSCDRYSAWTVFLARFPHTHVHSTKPKQPLVTKAQENVFRSKAHATIMVTSQPDQMSWMVK